MESSEFPPNSEASKKIEDKNLKRVTSGDVVRKKKPLSKRFKEVFIAGDPKTAVRLAVFEVLLPQARDIAWETISEYFRSLIVGGSRRYRGSTPPQSGPTGYVQYNRYSGIMGSDRPSTSSSSQRAMSRQGRARHDFDEIVLDSRVEAEEVIDRLFEVVSRYEHASVADLYELVGLASSHTDHKWGWTDLHGAGVSRVRGGYLLDLPEPQPLN